jgi:hypothetical protein
MDGGSASALPDSLLLHERAPPRTRLPIVTTLLSQSVHKQRPDISFRTGPSDDTDPIAEEACFDDGGQRWWRGGRARRPLPEAGGRDRRT